MLNSDLLSTSNIKEVLNEMWSYRDKWKFIGVQLGINIDTLDVIDADNSDMENCLLDLIIRWLNGGGIDSMPTTRSTMTAALRFVGAPVTCTCSSTNENINLIIYTFSDIIDYGATYVYGIGNG